MRETESKRKKWKMAQKNRNNLKSGRIVSSELHAEDTSGKFRKDRNVRNDENIRKAPGVSE